MGGVDNDRINPCAHETFNPFICIFANTYCRSDQQPALFILTGIGIVTGFLYVFYSNQALQYIIVTDHQDLFDSVLVQQSLNFVRRCALSHRYQPFFRGHYIVYGGIHISLESQIPVRDYSNYFWAIYYGNTRDRILLHQFQHILNPGTFPYSYRVCDYTAFEFFYLVDFTSLQFRCQISMDHAYTTLLGHTNCSVGGCHGIHSRGNQGNIYV